MSKLITARDIAERDGDEGPGAWIRKMSLDAVRRKMFLRAWDGRSVSGLAVTAFVDFGCWVARCDVCGGHCYVDPGEPIFFCLRCGNQDSGAARPVNFPAEIDAIEDALLARPVVDDPRARNQVEKAKLGRPVIDGLARNWSPGTSAETLVEQNKTLIGGA